MRKQNFRYVQIDSIGGVGFPKDANIYQTSRAPSYLFFAPTPVVKSGGFFIIPARCEEGAGSGVGEQRFLAAIRDAPNILSILDDARKNGYPPGQQRAFVLAKILEDSNVVIVGSESPDLVADCKMIPAATMEDALELASAKLGPNCDVLIVPHAMLTLPVICIEAVGHQMDTLNDCLALVKQEGTVLAFGVPDHPVYAIEYEIFFQKNAHLVAVVTPKWSEYLVKARDVFLDGRKELEALITHRLSLREAEHAFTLYEKHEDGILKALLDMTDW